MNYLRYEKGTAFLFVLILIILLGSITLTLFKSVLTNLKLTKNIAGKKKAFFAAEAGIAYGRYLICANQGFPQKRPDGSDYNTAELYNDKNISQKTKFKVFFEDSERHIDCILINAQGFYKKNTSFIQVVVDKGGNVKDYRVGTGEE